LLVIGSANATLALSYEERAERESVPGEVIGAINQHRNPSPPTLSRWERVKGIVSVRANRVNPSRKKT
jgi:hypothetical protein